MTAAARLDDDRPPYSVAKLAARRELESLKAKMDDEQNFLRSQIPRVYSDKETLTRQQIRHAERKNRGAPAEITMYGHRYQRID